MKARLADLPVPEGHHDGHASKYSFGALQIRGKCMELSELDRAEVRAARSALYRYECDTGRKHITRTVQVKDERQQILRPFVLRIWRTA